MCLEDDTYPMVSAVVKYDHNSPDSRQEIGKLPGSVSGSLRGCHLDMILMSPITLPSHLWSFSSSWPSPWPGPPCRDSWLFTPVTLLLFRLWSDSAHGIYLIQLSSLKMDRDTELCSTEADTETWSCLLLACWCLCVYWCTAQYSTVHSPPADVSTRLTLITGPLPARARRPGPGSVAASFGPRTLALASAASRPLCLAWPQLKTRPQPPQPKSHFFNSN